MSVVKTTIHDIARELNITASTVSRALNKRGSISTATIMAVEQTAKKLKYQHNKIASSLRLGKSNIIGVIIPSAEINFFGSVVHGIEKVASERDYNVLIYQSNEHMQFEKKGIQTFLRSRVDGVLASLSKETKSFRHYEEIVKRGIPLVLFDRATPALKVPIVVIDDFKGAYNATKHLVEQGCKRIAHIGGQQHVNIFKQRLNGYKAALIDSGLPLVSSLIKFGDVTVASGMNCMKELVDLAEAPDGVFAVEDFTALGAIQQLKNSGKNIPADVAVIGFANESFGAYITPSLSTVDQQTVAMGETAAQIFFDMIEPGDHAINVPLTTILEPVLVFRESSIKHPAPP